MNCRWLNLLFCSKYLQENLLDRFEQGFGSEHEFPQYLQHVANVTATASQHDTGLFGWNRKAGGRTRRRTSYYKCVSTHQERMDGESYT